MITCETPNTVNECMMCDSRVDLVECELLKPSPRFLCKNCRDEFMFDDEGNLKEDELEQSVMRVAAEYEDEEDY